MPRLWHISQSSSQSSPIGVRAPLPEPLIDPFIGPDRREGNPLVRDLL